ncbi:extensin family protein [Sphingomonas crusticola]|uniref:extensin-like domain-containing protein n=1 Tax=Sphingomonas crusticola TaxID=1697973 RepID=UPI000E24DDAE|nr:extensin family protein [Sphingomonas crusticola]
MAFLRGLRRLLTFMLIAAVGVPLLLVYLLPRLAPEDLPWTALDLDAPIGRATAGKIASLEGPTCRGLLARAGIAFRTLPPRRQQSCGFDDGIAWAAGGRRTARYAPAAPPLACPLAAALAVWEREVVQPAAEQRLGARVATIDHYGSYACRRIYGRETGDWSEHSRARALDVAGFVLSDGRRITVARDWNRAGATGQFLHDVRDGACRLFATTLSPDYNAAHRDHLHLDEARRGGFWTACR